MQPTTDASKALKPEDSARNEESSNPTSIPIWEVFDEIMEDVPDEDLRKLPTDGAEQHDHYLYGKAKRYA